MSKKLFLQAAIFVLSVGVVADLAPKHVAKPACEGTEVTFIQEETPGSLVHYGLSRKLDSKEYPVIGWAEDKNRPDIKDDGFDIKENPTRVVLNRALSKYDGQYVAAIEYRNGSTQHITFEVKVVEGCPDDRLMQADVTHGDNSCLLPLSATGRILAVRGSQLRLCFNIPVADPPVSAVITMPECSILMQGSSRWNKTQHILVDTLVSPTQEISISMAFESEGIAILGSKRIQVEVTEAPTVVPKMPVPSQSESTSPDPRNDPILLPIILTAVLVILIIEIGRIEWVRDKVTRIFSTCFKIRVNAESAAKETKGNENNPPGDDVSIPVDDETDSLVQAAHAVENEIVVSSRLSARTQIRGVGPPPDEHPPRHAKPDSESQC